MKRIISLFLIFVLTFATLAVLVACDNTEDPTQEVVDKSRTQLYVFNFGGGYGVEWLLAAKQRFEELHKDDVLEEGKKGVQIIIHNEKKILKEMTDTILDNKEEIYFTEYATYYSLLSKGILGDITDAVKADLGQLGDKSGQTIESKLTDEQKDYFDVDGKYYGVPHYSGYTGFTYNIDLFNKQGYYFRDYYDTTIEDIVDYFVFSNTDVKSAGPDGVKGTYDDGLPATFEEFFILCDYVKQSGDTPVIWNGKVHTSYIDWFIQALDANCDGFDQVMLDYTLSGEAKTLGKIVNGQFVKDATSTIISDSNATNVFRREGRYQALSFVEKLIDNNYYFQSPQGGSFNLGMTHLDAQDNFLFGGNDGETPNIAMLLEGIWWECEATDTFNRMEQSMGADYGKNARNFGFMPLPKPSKDKVGTQDNVLLDHIMSICFMKANIADFKKEIAQEFIKFVNTDQSLIEFTTITNMPKALNYTMTNEQLAKLSAFGRSVLEVKMNSQIVYPYSSHDVYVNHQGIFEVTEMYMTEIDGTERKFASTAFKDLGISAEDYFAGMYDYYTKNWAIYFNK